MKKSFMSASSRDRWSHCPGSVALLNRLKRDGKLISSTSDDALEGNAAHWLVEKILTDFKCDIKNAAPEELVRAAKVCVGWRYKKNDNEQCDITDEIVNGAISMLLFVWGKVQSCVAPQLFTELKLSWGTVDCAIWDHGTKSLNVIDFKFGFKEVKAANNKQVQCYALSLVEHLDIEPSLVTLTIMQPRISSEPAVKTYSGMVLELWQEQLDDEVHSVETSSSLLVPGIWCRYCEGKAYCPGVRAAIDGIDTKVDLCNDTVLGYYARIIREVIAPAEEDIKEEIRRRLLSREATSDALTWKLVPGKSKRAWKNSAYVLDVLQKIGVADVTETPKLKSVAQIEKLLKEQGIRVAGLDELVVKMPGNPVLVREEDKRKELALPPRLE